MKSKVRFSICVNPDEVAIIQEVAKRIGKSRSALIGDILHEWIKANAPKSIKEAELW